MATEILDLFFRLMTEKTFSHSMDSSLLISDVKALIETDSEIAPENQRLIFKGQLLKDEYTLQSYGLKSGNTIHVVGRVITVQPPESSATSTHSDVPNNVSDPDSTSDNTQQNTQGTEQTPEGQTGTGPNAGRGYGFPMGIFMSPIYATISVSGPSNVPTSENAMEQVASQFFSGVVNSLLTSFNNGPGTATNTPSARAPTSRSQNEELLVDLELSTSVLNRVTRSVKRLNSTPNSPRTNPDNVTVTSNIPLNTNTSGPESFESAGEFNNLLSTTGNVDHTNFRPRSPTNLIQPSIVTVNLDRGSQTDVEVPVNGSEFEEFEGYGGKVLLIDPEVLSSKLPWESLNKLERVLFDSSNVSDESFEDVVDESMLPPNTVEIVVEDDERVHQGFVVTEESVDMDFVDVVDEINSRSPMVNNQIYVEELKESQEPFNGCEYVESVEEVVDELYGNEEKENVDKEYIRHKNTEGNKEAFGVFKKSDRGNQTEVKVPLNKRKVINSRYNESEGPEVMEVTEENEDLSYEIFMKKFHSYELHLNEMIRDYNLGDKSTQFDRFKKLSSAMAIKTRIDVSLCALFTWMQTQMVSTERARAFATHMGWNTSSSTSNTTINNTSNNNNTSPTTPETNTDNVLQSNLPDGTSSIPITVPINTIFGTTNNTSNTNTSNTNNLGNTTFVSTSSGTSTFGTTTTSRTSTFGPNTTSFTSDIPGVREVTVELPVPSSGVGVGAVGGTFGQNNQGLTHNNPFNVLTTNPFITTQSTYFNSAPSNSDTSTMYNNTENTPNPEADVQQSNSRSSSYENNTNSTNQSDLLSRYRANPDFTSTMARVRQTKLSNSYHNL